MHWRGKESAGEGCLGSALWCDRGLMRSGLSAFPNNNMPQVVLRTVVVVRTEGARPLRDQFRGSCGDPITWNIAVDAIRKAAPPPASPHIPATFISHSSLRVRGRGLDRCTVLPFRGLGGEKGARECDHPGSTLCAPPPLVEPPSLITIGYWGGRDGWDRNHQPELMSTHG